MFVNLAPTKSHGLGRACCASCAEHGGSCGGMGHGVQEYLPVSWQKELAAFSLGGPIPPPRPGVQGLGDTVGALISSPAAWIVGLGLLVTVGHAIATRGRVLRSKRAYKRLRDF